MNSIASFMQNESAVIAMGMFGTILALVGIVVLGAFSVTSVIYRVPGGILSFTGVVIILAMFAFVQLMTSSMELQYGPAGPVVEYSFYALGAFLCILGYAKLTLRALRGRVKETSDASIA